MYTFASSRRSKTDKNRNIDRSFAPLTHHRVVVFDI